MSSRGIAGLVIASLLLPGCSSTDVAEKRAFLAAGLALQREAPEPSFAELRRELDLFLNDELQDLKDRTKRQEEKELSFYRLMYRVAGAAAFVAITSGTLSDSKNSGAQFALGSVSLAAAVAGFGMYTLRTNQMKDCRAFLDQGGADLAAWGRLHLVPSDARVPRTLWLDYVNRVGAIRAHESCLRIR